MATSAKEIFWIPQITSNNPWRQIVNLKLPNPWLVETDYLPLSVQKKWWLWAKRMMMACEKAVSLCMLWTSVTSYFWQGRIPIFPTTDQTFPIFFAISWLSCKGTSLWQQWWCTVCCEDEAEMTTGYWSLSTNRWLPEQTLLLPRKCPDLPFFMKPSHSAYREPGEIICWIMEVSDDRTETIKPLSFTTPSARAWLLFRCVKPVSWHTESLITSKVSLKADAMLKSKY